MPRKKSAVAARRQKAKRRAVRQQAGPSPRRVPASEASTLTGFFGQGLVLDVVADEGMAGILGHPSWLDVEG